MDSNKLANSLQVAANIGILSGVGPFVSAKEHEFSGRFLLQCGIYHRPWGRFVSRGLVSSRVTSCDVSSIFALADASPYER